jgi:Ran GTPase-activating protein (RanGAP) involved in mRNA processing and transport
MSSHCQTSGTSSKQAKLISSLFTARWLDLGIEAINTKLRANFMQNSAKIFKSPTLNFSNMSLGSESAKVLNLILMECYKTPSLKCYSKLDISQNSFCDASNKLILRAISTHKKFVYINLQNNDMDDMILSYFFRHLQENHHLVHLDIGNLKMLRRNKIKARSAIALGGYLRNQSVLQILNLDNIGINKESFDFVMEGVVNSNLISLNLSRNDITDDWIYTLNLQFNDIKYQLQELKLDELPITDKWSEHLASFLRETKIERLSLSKTQMRNEGLRNVIESIERNPNISYLNLSENVFSDIEPIVLEHFLTLNHQIKSLNLSNWRLSEHGILALALGLQQNKGLKNLNLSQNFISDKMFAVFVNKVCNNQILYSVDLSNNFLKKDEDIIKFIKGTNITVIKLRENYLDDSLAKWAIKFMTKLVNDQKEFHLSHQDEREEVRQKVPRSLKMYIENNSIKLSLLNHLYSLTKAQLPMPLPKPSKENPHKLFRTRTKIFSKVTLLKTDWDKNLDIVKNREVKMDKGTK